MKEGLPQVDMHKVVVLSITYNHSQYIEETLKGFAMQQTDFPFLCCIFDDASTDGEQEILKRWIDEHCNREDVEVFNHPLTFILTAPDKANPNCIYAIHLQKVNTWGKLEKKELLTHWQQAGEYIAMCEGDDYWVDPLKLQKQVDFLESHSDYVMTYTDAKVVDADGKSIPHRTPRRYSGEITKKLLENGNFITTASACFRNYSKEYAREMENVPFKLLMGDKPMWIFYSTIGKIKYFKEKMVAYRILSESASHSSNKDKLVAFNDNGELITKYFNARYLVGLSEEAIELGYDISRVRAMAKVSRSAFVETWSELVKKRWVVLFNMRLSAIAFIRIVLNRKV